ncbi:DEAD/DEAH box helicase [Desulfosporosinus sp. BICA1-9]|uniref:DEAD/DEAH box helicase n=1 Tax=Desulfosporosinus sp. BICA1-9 TaxID=1531958 RepID=UPI000AFD6BBB|nr:DEAD/DEAH box helicase [Desulfosporosinus sp. BICA1-9]HBW36884.1 ATP-dependent helicase [Desulfosporosinus sp.]
MPYFHKQTSEEVANSTSNVYSQVKKPLFAWQKECLDIWFGNQGKGVVNVVTGAGKTILALGAIARLEYILLKEQAPALKIKIVVPKVFLANQWVKSLQADLAVSREDIGVYSGVHKDPTSRKYMVYVVNSARTTLAQHLLDDYHQGSSILLIADECHHYCSPENSRIFSFIAQIPSQDPVTHYYALGLSATPETATFNETLLPALGPEIYKYSFVEALNANIISSFAIFNLRLKFTPDEERQYLDLSEQLTQVREILMYRCPFLQGLTRLRYFASLEQLAQSSEDENIASLARSVLMLATRRKDLVYRAESRITCVSYLVTQLPLSSKILVFCERIVVANTIYDELESLFPGQVGRYHSEMDEWSRKEILRKYYDSQIRILVSCRALDEGLNVPSTDIGIIASSTNSTRQRIQRLGRILRQSGIKRTAKLYYLYIGSSNEEKELLAGISRDLTGIIPILDLEYDQDNQTFHHSSYQALADRVIAYTQHKCWGTEIIAEITKNLERGKLGCDWWLSEQDCCMQIQNAPSRSEQNYWVSMRLLVQASLGRL